MDLKIKLADRIDRLFLQYKVPLRLLRQFDQLSDEDLKSVFIESVAKSVVTVDTAILAQTPGWVAEFAHDKIIPLQYHIIAVEKYLFPAQETKPMDGAEIYHVLKKTESIDRQLGFYDLMAIQAKGYCFFGENFGHNIVFAWRGIAKTKDGALSVPYLFKSTDDKVLLNWKLLRGSIFSNNEYHLQFKH